MKRAKWLSEVHNHTLSIWLILPPLVIYLQILVVLRAQLQELRDLWCVLHRHAQLSYIASKLFHVLVVSSNGVLREF